MAQRDERGTMVPGKSRVPVMLKSLSTWVDYAWMRKRGLVLNENYDIDSYLPGCSALLDHCDEWRTVRDHAP